jgi:hypothetical protein
MNFFIVPFRSKMRFTSCLPFQKSFQLPPTLKGCGEIAPETHSCPNVLSFFVSVEVKIRLVPAGGRPSYRAQSSQIKANHVSRLFQLFFQQPSQFTQWNSNGTTGQDLYQ